MFNNKDQNQGKPWALKSFLTLVVTLATFIASGTAFGQVADHPRPTSQAVVVLGEIENIFVDDMDDMFYDYEFCSINEENETFIDINNTGGKY